jgi:hypothetical protein
VRPKDAVKKEVQRISHLPMEKRKEFLFLLENILFSHEEPKEEPQRKTKRNLG